jgi:phospholipid N-methyltransferase
MYAENLISTPEAQADFYPTPAELGKRMLQDVDLRFVTTVLEPSAGKGDLICCLAEEVIAQEYRCNPHTLNVDAIEIDPYIRSILKYEFGGARKFSTFCVNLKIVPITITSSTKRLVSMMKKRLHVRN